MHMNDEEDDYCPSCGVPVPLARRGRACPHCGREFEDSGPRHLGTVFGYGVLGVTWGIFVGLALALTGTVAWGRGVGVPVTVGALGVLGLVAATQIGKRIEEDTRAGYEVVLLGLAAGAFAGFVAALWGVEEVQTVAAAMVVASAGVWWVARRR